MSTNTLLFRVEPEDLLASLAEARAALERADGAELLLDLTAVRRIDAAGVVALGDIARAAAERKVRLRARGVSVAVHKVLRLGGGDDGIAFMND